MQIWSMQSTQKIQLLAEYLTYLREGEHILMICCAVRKKLPLNGVKSTRSTSPRAITVYIIDIQQSNSERTATMATVIIPNNTNNCISRVAERNFEFRKSYLFLGSFQATHPQIVKEYNISAILTVGSGLEIQKSQGIAHKTISIEDNMFENIAQYFSECNEWISKQLQRGNVLVHCRAGVSRSASVVLAYTMKTKKVKLSTALQTIKEARSMIKPNQGFMGQLKQYQRKLLRAMQAKKLKLK